MFIFYRSQVYVLIALTGLFLFTSLSFAKVTKVTITKEADESTTIEQQVTEKDEPEDKPVSAASTSDTSDDEEDENDLWFLTMIFEILGLLGDWGGYVDYHLDTVPFETRFTHSGEAWWQDKPGINGWAFGLLFNMPLADVLEFEMGIGGTFGKGRRQLSRTEGTVTEHISLNQSDAQLRFIIPFEQYFAEISYSTHSVSTSLSIDSDLASYSYEGYLLDSAQMSSFSIGGGWRAPQNWPVRLRFGLRGYYQWADLGNQMGVRLNLTLLFKTRQTPEQFIENNSITIETD